LSIHIFSRYMHYELSSTAQDLIC